LAPRASPRDASLPVPAPQGMMNPKREASGFYIRSPVYSFQRSRSMARASIRQKLLMLVRDHQQQTLLNNCSITVGRGANGLSEYM
jgi:hypothetical protein